MLQRKMITMLITVNVLGAIMFLLLKKTNISIAFFCLVTNVIEFFLSLQYFTIIYLYE